LSKLMLKNQILNG